MDVLSRTAPAWLVGSACVLWLIAVGALDVQTGRDIGLSYFYLPAVAAATWYGRPWVGGVVALVATLVWFGADNLDADRLPAAMAAWNAGIRLAFFLTVVALLGAVRRMMSTQETLIAELRVALADVRTLSGLVPICAWCKRVRDDEGYWNSVESYVEARTKAAFSHGMCPQCHVEFMQSAELSAEAPSDPEAGGPKGGPSR